MMLGTAHSSLLPKSGQYWDVFTWLKYCNVCRWEEAKQVSGERPRCVPWPTVGLFSEWAGLIKHVLFWIHHIIQGADHFYTVLLSYWTTGTLHCMLICWDIKWCPIIVVSWMFKQNKINKYTPKHGDYLSLLKWINFKFCQACMG